MTMNVEAATAVKPHIRISRVSKTFKTRKGDVHALQDIDLTIRRGEFVSVLGPSGCGKSTLLMLLAGLIPHSRGKIEVDDKIVHGPNSDVGVVFQQARLSADPRLPLTDLIAEPLRATGRRDGATERVTELAGTVGLTPDLLARRPHEVSDGQLQRACLARALVLRPRWLICDEMTAMLDASTAAALVAAVEDYRATTGASLLAVGHDRTLLDRWCDRTVHWDSLAAADG